MQNSSSSEVGAITSYTDVGALASLRRKAAQGAPAALSEAAKQFETEFIRMMLKSMREAGPGDPLFGSDQADMYRDMFDNQISMEIARGKGLGLGDLLVQQVKQSTPVLTSREQFVERIRPAAERAARELGVSVRTVIAHAALETGWGRSLPTEANGGSSHNFFGIKAGSANHGAVANRTTEYVDGVATTRTERFKRYESIEAGFADYARLLGSVRYAGARGLGDDPAAFGAALQRAGYATDPQYAQKLATVARALGDIA